MAKKQIYRQAALDRLASPERLDAPARLVGGAEKLTLVAFILALGAALFWAVTARAPVTVEANGILIDRAGLVEISADRAGQLENFSLEPGAVVEAGVVVARLSQSDLRRDLDAAKARLDDARQRYERFERFFTEQKRREETSDAARSATISQTLDVLRERVTLLNERVAKTEELFAKKVVVQDRVLEAQIAAADARERVSALEEEALRLDLTSVERESERRITLLDEALNVEAEEREVDRLTSRLADRQVIRSAHSGRVVEVKVNAGDVVQPGDALATLAPLEGAGELEAVFYAPPSEGKRIEAGMIAEVSPGAVEREVFGFIRAEVASVSPLPATPEGMRRVLQNDQLVEQLSIGGAPIEVRLNLKLSPDTATGFEWSASDGPTGGVNAGTLLEGKVVVEERPLLDLMLPGATATLSRTVDSAVDAAGASGN